MVDCHILVCFLIFVRTRTRAAKSVLGKYYREPRKSGPIPLHLIENLVRSISQDHYVSNTGDIVYYQTDPNLNGSHHKSKGQ